MPDSIQGRSVWTHIRRLLSASGRARTDGARSLEALEPRCLLSAFVVDNLSSDDGIDIDVSAGNLTLREAVMLANASPGEDTIYFSPSYDGATLDLTLGELSITDDLIIRGGTSSGADIGLVIHANDVSRHFSVASGVSLLIDNITLTAGRSSGSGGSIYSEGSLTLERVIINESEALRAGAVYIASGGSLDAQDSEFNANAATSAGGGAITSLGTFMLERVTLAGNQAATDGGALELAADGSLMAVTVSGNSAAGRGGGVLVTSGSVAFMNSTLTLNRSDSDASGGEVGGGVHVLSGSLAMVSTIVSGNYRGLGVSTSDDVAGAVMGSFNLVGDAATAGGLIDGEDGNLIGADPMLGPLDTHGGSLVRSHALLEGSEAIDAGSNPGGLTGDVRGGRYLRNDGNGVDIGAYERQVLRLTVAHLLDESNGDTSDGDLSLREAIELTNLNPVADEIVFSPQLTGTLTLGGSAITIEDTVTITGPGSDVITIDANGQSRIFRIDDPLGKLADAVFIEGLTLTGGNGGGGIGGAILANERLTLFKVNVTGNSSSLGGGVYASATLIVSESTFTGNTSFTGGGAITFEPFLPEQIIIARTTISNNTASGGGGVLVFGSTASATILDSVISGNSSDLSGGGLAFYNGGTVTITGSTISGNEITSAGYAGGGIELQSPSATTITGSTISGNTGASIGGGIALAAGQLTLRNVTVSGNTALNVGGGVYLEAGNASIGNSTIAFNRADPDDLGSGLRGGGITNLNAVLSLVSTIVGDNTVGAQTAQDVVGVADASASSNNLISSASHAGGLTHNSSGNLVGVATGLGDLVTDLGSVATHPLLAGSPAISAGANPDNLGTDAAGQARVRGAGVDIGARESNLLPTISMPPLSGTLAVGQVVEVLAEPLDEDGLIVEVRWYVDANNDGVAQSSELVATDGDASNGWSADVTLPALDNPQAGVTFIVAATDDDGNETDFFLSGPFAINALPTFSSFEIFEDAVFRGDALTVAITNVVDADGSIREVNFYYDQNNDGVPDPEEFIGRDRVASNGSYDRFYRVDRSTPAGIAAFLAVVIDNTGAEVLAGPATVEILNNPPVAPTINTSTSVFSQGDFVSIGASGAVDVDGTGEIAAVRFYVDLNDDGIADESELIAIDDQPVNGFQIVLTREDTAALPLGTVSLLAVAIDPEGAVSPPGQTNVRVNFSLLSGANTTVRASAGADDLFRIVTVNQGQDALVFEQLAGEDNWRAVRFADLLDVPAALDDAVTWVDPKDGLAYAAYPSEEGLILLQRDGRGEWTSRNLTEELDGAVGPVRSLTQFVSGESTGSVVVIVGIDADGRLVAYQQRPAVLDAFSEVVTPADGSFTFVDISLSLDEGGFETPAYTELISYRTSWDAWHLAGLDDAGDIISVWTAPSVFTSWRTDNLSEVNGSAPLVGGLTAILTSWSGINLTGLNEAGEIVVTWWIPAFGGDWQNTNLTEAFDGPAISGRGLTGYYTSWDGMNYAGLDENNQIVIYWWVPEFGGQWTSSVITSAEDIAVPRPSGDLTSIASAAGTLAIMGASDNGDVIRASWQPGQGGVWNLENLSQLAERA